MDRWRTTRMLVVGGGFLERIGVRVVKKELVLEPEVGARAG